MAGHPTSDVNGVKSKSELTWTGGLTHLSGLPHLPGVPHLHVNRPLATGNAFLEMPIPSHAILGHIANNFLPYCPITYEKL